MSPDRSILVIGTFACGTARIKTLVLPWWLDGHRSQGAESANRPTPTPQKQCLIYNHYTYS